MRNPHRFDFKFFSVHQSRSAMKVCTDSCAFGAFADIQHARSILDIGTGTGLLSLMLAQKADHEIHIDAIDIDEETLCDARQNIKSSPWSEAITLHHADILNWNHDVVYDMIICNPPFHVRSTIPHLPKEAMAFHADLALPFKELVYAIKKKSHKSTNTWILLPPNEMDEFTEHACKAGFYIHQSICFRDTVQHAIIRKICVFSLTQNIGTAEECHIAYREYVGGPYTEEFSKRLSPFYLFL
ncbi:tRNA1(Val) (adenine(37)-N6)-methyltransferase [Chlorobiota bacterium]|nr:tRNA1(Val) (adenine(37)-N6)-methyltransferase [Chlorobiota bacterium]